MPQRAKQSKDRRARRVRLYRRGAGAAAAGHPRVEIVLLTADRRAGQEMRQVFPQFSPFELPRLVSIDGIDWRHAGARSRVLRAAARHDAEGDQASCSRAAPQTRVVDLSADFRLADPPPMRAGTATSTMRPSCSRRRSTDWPRSIATRSGRRGSSPIPAATRPARSFRSFRCCGRKRDRSRRDRDRCQVRHDRRGQGGEGGDAVLGSVGGLPRLWRRPSPPHGRARPGILQGRGPRRRRQLHARTSCR